MVSDESRATIVFACVHNAGRSQMAAGFFNALGDPMRAVAVSAGTAPAARVHPEVVEAMAEVGIDVSAARPARLTDELAARASLLVTMLGAIACGYCALQLTVPVAAFEIHRGFGGVPDTISPTIVATPSRSCCGCGRA